ncbi:hypothetical protein TNIN_433731 [Trichonephila inaurata madagascariensis]|uniref:Uncharacterized protein n=1 Tax=Trichonephila inaurata madagascariensis TaxID=2747483 RepID=A0A8X6XQD7_9ARAC|nr:hypothetical protein TNIN_433731 [Trichonephila inaurata madagascariensis]
MRPSTNTAITYGKIERGSSACWISTTVHVLLDGYNSTCPAGCLQQHMSCWMLQHTDSLSVRFVWGLPVSDKHWVVPCYIHISLRCTVMISLQSVCCAI